MLRCLRCGRFFRPVDDSAAHQSKHPAKYCSRACGRTWRRNGGQVRCTQCGRVLYRRRSHLALTIRPFCSSPCYGEWQKTHQKETRDDLREWRRMRPLALARDGYACQDCGQTQKRLVVHHLRERLPGQSDNHALDNLVTVCDICHRRRHS